MKKFLASLVAITTLLLPSFATAPAYAVDIFQSCNGNVAQTDVCNDVKTQNKGGNPIISTIKTIINIISLVVGVASVIIIIVSGLRMVLSNGDTKAVEQARSGIVYALVGIVVTLFSQAIVLFILNRF